MFLDALEFPSNHAILKSKAMVESIVESSTLEDVRVPFQSSEHPVEISLQLTGRGPSLCPR